MFSQSVGSTGTEIGSESGEKYLSNMLDAGDFHP